MPLILCDISALEFWRACNRRSFVASERPTTPRRNAACWHKPLPSRIEELREKHLPFLSDPVHLYVPDAETRCRSDRLRCHIWPEKLPRGSFAQIADDVFVSRPEPCIIWAARRMHFAQAVLVGLELCGTYRLPVGNRPTTYQVPPLTSSTALNSFVGKASGVHGSADATRALRYIVDGSESPMESILFELISFPLRIGGRGLRRPELNYRLKTTSAIRKATGKSSFRCDMFWPEAGVAVEYDSNERHTGPENISDDATRRAALMSLGIEVVTVTHRQIQNINEFNIVVHTLEKLLGMRRQPTKKQWHEKELELRATILSNKPHR